jgi:hypothetical protein
MEQQTAVEWLLNWMGNNQYFIGNDLLKAIEQAKEMEKQQIIDAYHINPLESKWNNIGENYYKETYEKK